jgi:catechol 2,3-dioxygenase-like lactoylglutathione lyase family enzyme
MNRMNIICLGVRDMETSIKFYRDGLGFKTNEKSNNPEVIFFSNSGTKLELYPLKLLAKDINENNPPEITNSFGGITLAYNAKSKAEVHEIIDLQENREQR